MDGHTANKPKILIFSMGYDPFIGGAEIAIRELTKRLAHQYEFHIVTCHIRRELPRVEDKGYITIYRVGLSRPGADNEEFSRWPLKLNKILFPFLAYWKAIWLHRKHRFEGHWCMMAYTGALGSLMFKLTFPQVKYMLELQSGHTYEERKKIFGPIVFPFIRWSFQKADAIKSLANSLIVVAKRMGATAPMVRVPNGVDTGIFTRTVREDEKQSIADKLALTQKNLYLISTTRLVANRGHEALIGSLVHLPADYMLILCGSGPHEKPLRALSEKLGVKDRITWAGDVDYAEIPKYLANARCFVRPSVYEGMGNSFIEAFAFGIPVVGTPVGGIVDFLFDDEKNIHPDGLRTGFVATVNDPQDIAKQILKVFENPEETANRMKNAKELALREYDWDYIAKRMHNELLVPMLDK